MLLCILSTIPVELYTDSKTDPAASVDMNSRWYSIHLTMNKIKEFINTSTDFTYQSLLDEEFALFDQWKDIRIFVSPNHSFASIFSRAMPV